MIFDLYTTLKLESIPQRTVLTRAMSRVYAMDNPIGNPFGGPAYGEYNSAVVEAVESAGRWIDREVLQPVYREVVQPVGKALEIIGKGIAKDPLTFIAQAAAVALAPATGGQSLWALPVISAASTAAKGGSMEQILTATAISAATAAIGGGFGIENSVGGLITSGLQTGVNAAGQATFGIMGTSITATTAQAIATAGTGIAMAGVQGVGAAIQGKDPLMAALPSLVGSALGFAGNMAAQAEFFAPISNALNELSKNTSPIVSKAMTGVASAMITGAVTGKDMSQVALAGLANTVVSGLVSASGVVQEFFAKDDGSITNLGVAAQSVVADLVGSVAATLASGGKLGTEMGAQFLASTIKTIMPLVTDPKFDAMATNVRATYEAAEKKVTALNNAANAQQGLVDKYNADAAEVNRLAKLVNDDIAKRDEIVRLYNAATTQGDIDKYRQQFNEVEARIAANTNAFNKIYDTIDDTNAAYLASVKATETAQNEYFEISKTLGSAGTQLSAKMNEISKEVVTNVAKSIDPNFNAEEYKELNNLGPNIDAAVHFLSVGKDTGLFTNKETASSQRDTLIEKATMQLYRANGWNVTNVPEEQYNKTKQMIGSFYGYNMSGLQNFTVNDLVTQSKMPATWYAPMWDESTKTITDAKVLFQGGKEGEIAISDTTLPEGMDIATFYDIYNGKANLTRGNDGNFYWTTNNGATAKILDRETGEIVNTTYSTYFADSQLPANAYDITRDEQGRVVGYRTPEGGLSVVVTGANNDQAEYLKDYGTKFEDVDPTSQMYTYAEVTDGIAANFNIKGIVQASKDIVDYMQNDATDLQKLQIATIVKSGGSVLQDVGTVLQDLSVTIGLSKTGDQSVLSNLGKQLENLANAKTPEQYQAAMRDIDEMRKAAKGTDILNVNKAIAEKYPDLVGVSVFGGELFEEFIQTGLGKATGAAAGALALTLGAPAAVTAAIAGVAGYGASMALDYAESYRGAKEDMYTRMYDVYKDKGYSDAQAAQMADAAASKAGVVNGMITLAVNGIAPGDLNKVLFGGKANPAQQVMMDYFLDKVKTAGVVAASEFGQGLVEGTLQGAYNESLVYSVDPSKADYWKGIADSAMLESVIGAPVSAGVYGASVGVESIAKTFTAANETFTKAIESSNIYTVGELGSVFKQWGIPTNISTDIVYDIVQSKPSLADAYTSAAEYQKALEQSFGFDAMQAASIANIKFNDQIVTTQEAKDKLFESGLTGVTDEDVRAANLAGANTATLNKAAATYADQQMVAEDELKAAAQQENYTYAQEELDKLIGRGVETDVIAKFISEIDPKAVTVGEAKEYFKNLGYDNATSEEIAQFVKSVAETQVQEEVSQYVDPRQVTREEAVGFYQELGYTPTEQEIQQFIKHGKDIKEAQVKSDLGGYVDPRMVDSQEVKDMLQSMGLIVPPTEADIARLSGQYMETELAGKAKEALPVVAANATYAETKRVADLVGKPAQDVTQADFDYIRSVVEGTAQGQANLAYDANQDGKIDQADLDLVKSRLDIQQNQNIQQQIDPETGLTVYVDTTTGQPITAQPPALGGQWAPTGIYAALQQQEARQAQIAKAQSQQAKQAQQKNQFGQLMNMIFSAPDAAGQEVTVKTPEPSKINYIYDWSSIFATPAQASMMPSPYGPMNTVAPQQQKQPANQPMFKMASGFSEGGIVGGNDINVGDGGSVDDLINLLKGNSG